MAAPKKLGIFGLIAAVFGPMVGSGIFNIPQNMSAEAGAGAVMLSWLITAAGILCLVITFKLLSTNRPDLNAGIYQYARAGFGNYAGFNIAWGYWLCTAFGNIAYAVMLNDAFGAFWPELLRHGWATVAFGSVLIWGMYLLVVNGINTASMVSIVINGVKFAALAAIVGLLIAYFKTGLFTTDFWGRGLGLGSLWDQTKSTMLVTLWCFIGIEGAVMMSARAKRARDVGKASIAGFLLAWVLYALISLLCFGIMGQPEMAKMENPSIAYVLREACGNWIYYFVVVAVIVSLLGGWVAWTLICSEVPLRAAEVKIFPKKFTQLNRHQMPAYGLLMSTIAMQIFLFVVVSTEQVYLTAVEITSMMVLPAYLFSALFLWKAAAQRWRYLPGISKRKATGCLVVGIICSAYCLWLIYAGGLRLMLTASLFYLSGTYFFVVARKHQCPGEAVFTSGELFVFWLLVACGAASVAMALL